MKVERPLAEPPRASRGKRLLAGNIGRVHSEGAVQWSHTFGKCLEIDQLSVIPLMLYTQTANETRETQRKALFVAYFSKHR